MFLSDFKSGEKGRVVSFSQGAKEYKKRLFSLGVLPGTEFEVVRVAPLGDPVEIVIRGSNLSVRKNEIQVIEVEKI